MKKTLLSALLSLLSITMYAYSCNQHVLHLSAGYVDETPAYHGKGKAPVRIPVIYQDNHAFSFQSCHPEYIINIVQDGEVVFTSVVPADAAQFELPDYISGECIIQFMTGNYCFWAEIEL